MGKIDYNQISQVYDDVREGDVQLIARFLEELSEPARCTVIDIGCGTGNYTDLFQKLSFAQMIGVDPSEGMLEKARQKNPEIRFLPGTADCLPVETGSIDFAFMTDVIHHVPDLDAMFTEIHRVLKPEGKVCIVTQSHRQIEGRAIAEFFPATARVDCARYPDIPRIVEAAQSCHLQFTDAETRLEGGEIELGPQYLELVRKKGYSMLHLISEEEYQQGLSRLEKSLHNGPIRMKSAGQTLVWFAKTMISTTSEVSSHQFQNRS